MLYMWLDWLKVSCAEKELKIIVQRERESLGISGLWAHLFIAAGLVKK